MPNDVVSVRVEQADAHHDHVDLVGCYSVHIAMEPIMLSTERTLQRIALGEKFVVKDGDAEIELVSGKCPECGHEPYLRTAADQGDEQKLMGLPRG